MRDDPTSRSETFSTSDLWDRQKYVDVLVMPRKDGGVSPEGFRFESNSLSGNERNRLLLQSGDNFADLSLLSGVDDLDDGRSHALLDYDGDGWLDIAALSLNAPRFKLYRNRLGDYYPKNGVLRVKLRGRHDQATPSATAGNRQAVGATLRVRFDSGRTVLLQKQLGEGFASQNSEVLSIGCPAGETITRLEITWPSGRRASLAGPSLDRIQTFTEPAK